MAAQFAQRSLHIQTSVTECLSSLSSLPNNQVCNQTTYTGKVSRLDSIAMNYKHVPYHSHGMCKFILIVTTTMAVILLFRFKQDFALFESQEILGHAFNSPHLSNLMICVISYHSMENSQEFSVGGNIHIHCNSSWLNCIKILETISNCLHIHSFYRRVPVYYNNMRCLPFLTNQ